MGTNTAAKEAEFDKKAFDETKAGVKGLVDARITEIPRLFHMPPDLLSNKRPPVEYSVPIIDLDGVKNDLVTRKNVVEKIKDASETYGFFQVINHGVPPSVLQGILAGTQSFHEQDVEEKKKYYTRDKNKKLGFRSNNDLYKATGANWRDAFFCDTAPDAPPPEQIPHVIRDSLLEYAAHVMEVGQLLFELLSESLGLPSNYLKEMDCTKALSHIFLYYPPCPQPDRALGLKKHSDNSFITVLLQDHIGGLQILHEGYWIDVHPISNGLLVNIGDFLQILTNDKYKSVDHRVLANKVGPRISVGSFFDTALKPNPKVYGPINELLSEDNPPRYRDFTLEEYNHLFAERGLDAEKTLNCFKI